MATEKQIQNLAYKLWEQAGCPQGRDDEFWRAAKAELEFSARTLKILLLRTTILADWQQARLCPPSDALKPYAISGPVGATTLTDLPECCHLRPPCCAMFLGTNVSSTGFVETGSIMLYLSKHDRDFERCKDGRSRRCWRRAPFGGAKSTDVRS